MEIILKKYKIKNLSLLISCQKFNIKCEQIETKLNTTFCKNTFSTDILKFTNRERHSKIIVYCRKSQNQSFSATDFFCFRSQIEV